MKLVMIIDAIGANANMSHANDHMIQRPIVNDYEGFNTSDLFDPMVSWYSFISKCRIEIVLEAINSAVRDHSQETLRHSVRVSIHIEVS
jgi:hypothetical protein